MLHSTFGSAFQMITGRTWWLWGRQLLPPLVHMTRASLHATGVLVRGVPPACLADYDGFPVCLSAVFQHLRRFRTAE